MTKRYQILQKKLSELESSIERLSSLYPAATPSHLLPHIAQQLLFSRKLLSAEISSHPSKPHHLAHISHHLDRLDAIFRGYQHQHDDPDDNGDFPAVDGLDAASACSCTESCLDDDGEGDGELGSELCEEPEEMFYEAPGLVAVGEEEEEEEEKVSVEVGRVVVERTKTEKGDVEREEEEGDGGWWWCFGVLGGGLVVGAAVGAVLMCSVMVRFSGCFHHTEYEGSLVPT